MDEAIWTGILAVFQGRLTYSVSIAFTLELLLLGYANANPTYEVSGISGVVSVNQLICSVSIALILEPTVWTVFESIAQTQVSKLIQPRFALILYLSILKIQGVGG
jgi:hypothetical protein